MTRRCRSACITARRCSVRCPATTATKGEFLQVGAEFIGADGLEADKDILTAAFAALSKTGADNFRVELGHAEIYKALMDELGADAQSAEGIRRLIENKSFAALGDALGAV